MREKRPHSFSIMPLWAGVIIWLFFLLTSLPYSPFDIDHVKILLLAAPLWLIPIAWQVIRLPHVLQQLSLASTILFSVSFLLEKSFHASLLTVPWLVLCFYALWLQLSEWHQKDSKTIADHSQLAAFIYLPVGVAWAFADRIGFQPMGFSPTITLLTAVHFHYAGFLLPILGALYQQYKHQLAKWEVVAAWGIIAGVPLTAAGITATQFQLSELIELSCVTLMAGSAFLLGFSYLKQGWTNNKTLSGVLWILSGTALIAGMSLALAYGWRSVIYIPQLTIPWMYAVHGTLNAIGFALPGILGWWFFYKKNHSAK